MNSINITLKSLLMVLVLSFASHVVSAKDIIYVKSGSTGDGSSWSKALGNIQQAVDSAAKKGADVWVAKGIYKSDTLAVLTLKPNVNIYGGFAGTEKTFAARDTAKNPTILDGDGKDRVVDQTTNFVDTAAIVVDGFTIQNGSSNIGGGVYLKKNSTLNNCIVKNNTASSYGIAIYAEYASVKNCIICDNTSSNGTRNIFLSYSVMDSCVVKNNTAFSGSAVYAVNYSTVSNTTFESNKNNYRYSYAPIELNNNSNLNNCVVTENYGHYGAVYANGYCKVKNCSFSRNVSSENSAVHIENSSTIENSEIFENEGEYYEIVYLNNRSSMDRCKIFSNVVDRNHYVVNIRDNCTLSNSLIYDNKSLNSSYAILALHNNAKMVNATIANNETGATIALDMYNSSVTNSIVVGTKYTKSFLSTLKLNGTNTLSYSMIEGGVEGIGNITATKDLVSFVDPENGDYSLSEKSFAINAGTSVDFTYDLLGNARKLYGAEDMGAIESSYTNSTSFKKFGDIIYVKQGSDGDGSSWKSAFGEVSDAVKYAAFDGKRHQIWVAAGTYYGDTTSLFSIILERGISIYGGFSGKETSLSDRDTAKNPTILDGQNKRRLLTQNYDFADSSAIVIDGFTIQNGLSQNGGGAYLRKNTSLNNCIVKNCHAVKSGMAIYANGSKITNSVVSGNGSMNDSQSDLDGVLYLVDAVVDNCVVKENAAYNTLLISESSTISNSLFERNEVYRSYIIEIKKTAVSDCKFIGNINSSDYMFEVLNKSKVERCLFNGNNAYSNLLFLNGSSAMTNSQITNCNSRLGNIIYINGASTLSNCTVVDNESKNSTVYSYSANKITNSIFVGNKRSQNTEHFNISSDGMVSYSLVEGGMAGEGNIDGNKWSAAFVDSENGDYSLSEKSVCINSGTDVSDTLDLLGKVRRQSDAVDMGAIESSFAKKQKVDSIIYVKEGSNGSGLSWNDALGEINQAIYLASTTGKRHQVWVAAGTYHGDTTLESAISLAPGVSLYGGFAGTESSLDERDAANNVTIIDGCTKSRCLIQNFDFVDSMAIVIDGFTIQNGESHYFVNGANAMTKKNTSFINCVFTGAKSGDVAVSATYSEFRNCKFINNKINELYATNCIVDSCSFTGNSSSRGTRIIVIENTMMTNSTIHDNNSPYGIIEVKGNAVASNCKIYNNVSTWNSIVGLNNGRVVNSLIYGNVSNRGSNSIIYSYNNSSLINTTVANNKTVNVSTISGYYSSSSSTHLTIVNSIIYGNKMTSEVYPQVNEDIVVKYCASDDDLNGENNIKLASVNNGADSTQNYVCFINAVGGDYRLHSTSSCIDKGLDSLMTAKTDVNGGARIYGKAIDLGAHEYDGVYVEMLDYNQVVCGNKNTFEVTFDSTTSKIDWEITSAGKINGYDKTSGSGSSIPSMKLYTTNSEIDVLTMKVTPYDKDSVAGVPFSYNFYVYPDFSDLKVTFKTPKEAYVVNDESTSMTITWNKLSLPIDVEHSDLYVWKSSDSIPSTPLVSLANSYSKYIFELDNHTTYKYMVKMVTECDTVYSDIDSFRIDIPESLEIFGSSVCELGTKVNSSTYSRRYIKGFELNDSITYSISGADTADFSVVLHTDWKSLTGGYFDVYYNPTDSKKAFSNATLTFVSGKYKAELDLKGTLANYYVFDAVVEKEVYKAGDTVAIKAFVADAYGNPYVGKALKVSVRKNGFDIQTFEKTSDENGEVSVDYVSSIYESGSYSVNVCMSGSSSDETFADFDIPGISCSTGTNKWLVQKGDTISGFITVTNRSNVETRNIKVKTLTLADGCKVVFDSIDVLSGLESKKVNYYIIGETLTEGSNYLPSTFRVETADGLTSEFTTYFYCEMPYGQIQVLPANINEVVSKQKSKYIELTLVNNGIGETGKVTVSLPKFDGISMPNGTEIESIKAGDTVKATLKLAYYDGAKLNTPITGTIGFNCENGKSTSINFSMEYTSSLVGSVTVDVVDEYYYNSTAKNHLAGATVEIQNAFNYNVVASAITDSTGKVAFDSIPEGTYLLVVKSEKHSDYKETITVQAGKNLDKFVFVSYQAVTYTWNVVRTEIEDKYEINLETTYETNVPAPVVTAEFPKGIPSKEDIKPGEKYIANLVITNHGLIAARYVSISVPSMKYFKFTPEVDNIDSLPANSSVIVPVTIERANPNEEFEYDNQNGDNQNGGNGHGSTAGLSGWKLGLFDVPSVGGIGNNNGGGSSSADGDVDCPSIVIGYFYWCGKYIGKSIFVILWDCTSSAQSINVIFEGSANVSISSVTTGDCDEKEDEDEVTEDGDCESKVDSYLSCAMDAVGWIPVLGDLIEGSYKVTSTIKYEIEFLKPTIEFISDAYTAYSAGLTSLEVFMSVLNQEISPRDIARNAYEVATTVVGLIPGVGDLIPFGCLDLLCQATSCKINGIFAENCGEFRYDFDSNALSYLEGLFKSADPMAPFHLACRDMEEFISFEINQNNYIAECFGFEDLLKKNGALEYLDLAIDSYASVSKIDINEVKKLPVSDLSLTDMISVSERWNRTVDAWNNGIYASNDKYPDIASKEVVDKCIDGMANCYKYVGIRGFEDIPDMLEFINNEMAKHKQKKNRKGVCASVKLQLSQTMSMTRDAFDGTLTVNNGKETLDMDNFTVALEIRDEQGNLANGLFQINTQSLIGIADVDGNSSIAAGKEASVVFRFIPERGAAPTTPVNYSFGGKIIYVEAGDTITIDLNPVTLTVYPSPDLQIDYFMQRNILGDDALTLDRVEPSVPAALGVRIVNQGYGDAKNVKLESAQPEIVDNEKGLLIDFNLVGSSLNGKNINLGSENIDFGNVEAKSAKTGVWWLTSSLLGHFTEYNASVVHTTDFGNSELSIVSGVAIHELIKTVDAYDKKDEVVDFLVNDYADENDTPDAIYYSNGGKDTVKIAKRTSLDVDRVTIADSVVTLTVTPSDSGWNYAQMADPGDNVYEIKKVVRVADNVEIPLDNVWSTFVTIPDGAEPIYENRLHFLDYMTTLGENDYKIYYSLKKNLLEVTGIVGVPQSEETDTVAVESVVVTFNRKIQKSTFDYNDIELYCQAGDNLSDSTITISQRDDYSYVVNISSKTKTSGFYKLEINVDNVFDETGYPGVFGKSAAWGQLIESEDEEDDDDDYSPFVEVENDEIVVYTSQNRIYVKSSKSGILDIYDVLSRLIMKNAQYGEGITQIATLPNGIYIINGEKLFVK